MEKKEEKKRTWRELFHNSYYISTLYLPYVGT